MTEFWVNVYPHGKQGKPFRSRYAAVEAAKVYYYVHGIASGYALRLGKDGAAYRIHVRLKRGVFQ